jgi:hypothetical protein
MEYERLDLGTIERVRTLAARTRPLTVADLRLRKAPVERFARKCLLGRVFRHDQ